MHLCRKTAMAEADHHHTVIGGMQHKYGGDIEHHHLNQIRDRGDNQGKVQPLLCAVRIANYDRQDDT